MKLSIIIVNWNTEELLRQLLVMISRYVVGLDYEVIVVDNNSGDDSVTMLKKEFPQVKLIANDDNLGFAKANNQGMAVASGEYMMLLNTDIILHNNAIGMLVDFLDTHPDVTMVGPQLLNKDGTFQHACRRNLPNPINSFFHIFGFTKIFKHSKLVSGYKRQNDDPNTTGPTEAISGAAMMFRRGFYEACGGLDENFFFYGEDIDFCKRVYDSGGQIVYVSAAKIVHLGGESSKKRRRSALSNFYDAMWRYYRKHFYHQHNLVLNIVVWVGIKLRLGIAIVINYFK